MVNLIKNKNILKSQFRSKDKYMKSTYWQCNNKFLRRGENLTGRARVRLWGCRTCRSYQFWAAFPYHGQGSPSTCQPLPPLSSRSCVERSADSRAPGGVFSGSPTFDRPTSGTHEKTKEKEDTRKVGFWDKGWRRRRETWEGNYFPP